MTTQNTIRAVLWDFGGVLTTSPFEAFNRFEETHGIPLNFIRSINARNPEHNAWAQFESNQISLEEFDQAFLEESTHAGYPVAGRQVIQLLSGDIRPGMVRALKRCKKKFKVACLTNNVKSGTGPGMARNADKAAAVQEVMALFEWVLESSREGIRKPNPEFYLRACERLNVACSEVVYLDDLGINLKPARKLGMTTIKVMDEATALEQLGNILGIEFD